ncbi:MAG: DUF2865 domain-containing protein [Pseudomonadota bacterium]
MKIILVAFFTFLFTAGAIAQSCTSLRSQLASAQAGKPNRAVVASLEKRARAFGCNQRSRWGQNRSCAGIDAQLRQARSGLVNRNRVRRLRRAISRHCETRSRQRSARNNVRRSEKGNRRNIFSAIFGGRRRAEDRDVPSAARGKVERVNLDVRGTEKRRASATAGTLATQSQSRVKGSTREGGARTMCVRLCDGFYFPINNRSHSDNYYDELAMCVGRCPGADVSLYVHYNGEAVEQMRSAMTGEAYVNLPTAFDYRKSLRPTCGCANGTQIARGAEGQVASTASGAPKGSVWQPYRAVYDGTGKPLSISRTAYGAKRDTAKLGDAAATAPATPAPLSRGPIARAAAEPAQAFDPEADKVRAVGDNHFSRAVADFAAAKDGPVRRAPRGPVPTAITVTPLRPSSDEAARVTSPRPTPDEAALIQRPDDPDRL